MCQNKWLILLLICNFALCEEKKDLELPSELDVVVNRMAAYNTCIRMVMASYNINFGKNRMSGDELRHSFLKERLSTMPQCKDIKSKYETLPLPEAHKQMLILEEESHKELARANKEAKLDSYTVSTALSDRISEQQKFLKQEFEEYLKVRGYRLWLSWGDIC